MKNLNKGKILIIPDIHQNIGFVDTILLKEKDWNKIVFLGDYFDSIETPSSDNKIYSFKNTCKWINKKYLEFGEKAIWLLGNHDCSYFATHLDFTFKHYNPQLNYYYCSGWTKSKASTFNKIINPKWIKQVELCCQVGNYICSHAGFHYNHFKPFKSEIDNIKELYNKWENDKSSFKHIVPHWIYYVGLCRGGFHDVGSPIWLDWNQEFQPIDNINQIVGHTSNNILHKAKSNNYCIDIMQKKYAIYDNETKNLDIKTINYD